MVEVYRIVALNRWMIGQMTKVFRVNTPWTKLAFVSSFHYYEDSDCTNGEHTNNTKADNQRQGGVFRIKKGNN